MVDDLKIIKKKYGENMMHLCRELFVTLLDTKPGILSKLMLEHFEESKFLYDDIVNNKLEENFKNFIYDFVDMENHGEIKTAKTPIKLLKEVGYTLYECKTEEDIQSFKKYYKENEALCTFKGGRLNRCHVFFAVKDNVNEIKRENFEHPQRQDEYGTSVISIQFTRDNSHTLSIKNRYNHTVNNPDSTFSNNLDNIVEGLTYSFEEYYGMEQKYVTKLEIPGYLKACNGKYYKFNHEINNIYYCTNNVIIDNFEVKQFPAEQYIIADYFVIDLKNKKIEQYDKNIYDSFIDSIGDIENIKVQTVDNLKRVIIKSKNGEDIIITLDKENNIIELVNNNVKIIEDAFMKYNTNLEIFAANKLEQIKTFFLFRNISLKQFFAPNLESIGEEFLANNEVLEIFEASKLCEIDNWVLTRNRKIQSLYLPKLKTIGLGFLQHNHELTNIVFNIDKMGRKKAQELLKKVNVNKFLLSYDDNINNETDRKGNSI